MVHWSPQRGGGGFPLTAVLRFGPLRRVALSAGLAGAAMLAVGTTVVLAYPPPAASATLVSGCTKVSPGTSCAYVFNFVNASGQPVTGAVVAFGAAGLSTCSVRPTTGSTNSGGNVTTTLSCGTTRCGTVTVTATSAPATASATVTVPCTGGALPGTSTIPPSPPPWLWGIVSAAVLVFAAGGLSLRRLRTAS